MLRSCLFAAGLFVGLCGVSLLFVDKLVLHATETVAAAPAPPQQVASRETGLRGMFSRAPQQPQAEQAPQAQVRPKVIDPPDWAAFSLMSVGSVAMLYAVALPRKLD